MRKNGLGIAVAAIAFAASSAIAHGQVHGPEPWDGHRYYRCEPVTHASYYDGNNWYSMWHLHDYRRGDQWGWSGDESAAWNSRYYVDTNPMADFDPSGTYESSPTHECDGTPVAEASAYASVTVQGELWLRDEHIGYPTCSAHNDSARNPACSEGQTGVYGGAYVGDGQGERITGTRGGVENPFSCEAPCRRSSVPAADGDAPGNGD